METKNNTQFVMIHYDVIEAMDNFCEQDSKINKATLHYLYFRLLKHANTKTNKCCPSYKTIMEETGIKDKHTLMKYLNLLEDGGFIYINSGREHVSNNYYFPMESWFKMPEVLERRHGGMVEDDKGTKFRKELIAAEKEEKKEQEAQTNFKRTNQENYDKLCADIIELRKYYEKLTKKETSDKEHDNIISQCYIATDNAVKTCDIAFSILKQMTVDYPNKASLHIRNSMDRINRQRA